MDYGVYIVKGSSHKNIIRAFLRKRNSGDCHMPTHAQRSSLSCPDVCYIIMWRHLTAARSVLPRDILSAKCHN